MRARTNSAKRRRTFLTAWLVICFVCYSSCLASNVHPIRGFVEKEGKYPIDESGRELIIFKDEDRLNVSFGIDTGPLYPADPIIDPDYPWFAFVESGDRVWIYNGDHDLLLFLDDSRRIAIHSLDVSGDWLRKQIPPEVSRKLPKDL